MFHNVVKTELVRTGLINLLTQKGVPMLLNGYNQLLTSDGQSSVHALAKKANEMLEAKGATAANVFAFDKDEQKSASFIPAYSSLIVTYTTKKGDEVENAAFTLMIGDTGAEERTAEELLAAVDNKERFVAIPTDTYDNLYEEHIVSFLSTKLENGAAIGECTFIPAGAPETVIMDYVLKAVNADIVTLGVVPETLNLAKHLPEGVKFDIVHHTATTDMRSELAMPKATKWGVELTASIESNDNLRSVNVGSSRSRIMAVSGTFDWFFVTKPAQVQGQAASVEILPLIITNQFMAGVDTVGHILLGLGLAQTLATQDFHQHIIANLDRENVASLGLVTVGEAPKLDKGKSAAAKEAIIKEIIGSTPAFGIDIPMYSDGASSLATFARAANTSAKYNDDRKLIVEAARELTNGAFPATFPIDRIFAKAPVTLPEGFFVDKTGTDRPIASYTMASILDEFGQNGIEMAYQLANANAGIVKDPAYPAPFFKVLDVIRRAGYNPRVATRVERVMFTPEFISTLAASLASAGLVADIRAPKSLNETIGFINHANPYAAAMAAQGYENSMQAMGQVGSGYLYTPFHMGQ